jgi:hypothetical protein
MDARGKSEAGVGQPRRPSELLVEAAGIETGADHYNQLES